MTENVKTKNFKVSGMSCGHCENAVKEELSELVGIEKIDVSAQSGELKVTLSQAVSDEQIIAAVEEAGYSAAAF